MDSASIYVLGVIVLALLVTLAVVLWRFTSIHGTMTAQGSRVAERNELQRDRFLQTVLEKMQVNGHHREALAVAQMHSNEAQRQQINNLRRDEAGDDGLRRTRHLNEKLSKVASEEFSSAQSSQDGMG